MEKFGDNVKYICAIVIYAALTWIWFDLNYSYSLPLIGHTELVHGWVDSDANKLKLIFDLFYFSISIATFIVITEIALDKIPGIGFIKSEKYTHSLGASFLINIFLLFYQFHILEFRIKLIGLAAGLIIFFVIGVAIAFKVLDILCPILGILDISDSIENINDKK